MKNLYTLSRYLVGVLFIFSGLIKINDPIGTQIKLEEYFEVFSADFTPLFEHLVPLALILSVILCTLEIVIGIALLMNYKMKITRVILLSLIVFFTFLTFYSAYFNKVTDCGCFGDAIKLTPWESFTKDIILLSFSLIIFILNKKVKFLSNNAGGIEGGMSSGQPVVIHVAIKPISTLSKPLPSVNIDTGERVQAHYERSDVCQVPPACVIGEACLALVLADALLEKFGGDNLNETLSNHRHFQESLKKFPLNPK